MSFPKPLLPGDTIGIAAPSGSFDQARFASGLSVIKKMGFKTAVPGRIHERWGYLAGTDKRRAELINELFSDPGIDAVWCARGGYGAIRILPLIDYEAVKARPKPFIGSSDATALLSVFSLRCSMPVFHGPMIVSLADADEKTKALARKALMPGILWSISASPRNVIRPGRAEGKVLGGNLATLCHLTGTPFEPDFADCLLFIEDTGEAPYRIDRMLTQMRLAGLFRGVKGLMLGAFTECGDRDKIFAIVEDIFSDFGIPILGGIPAGHGRPNIMLPMGCSAVLDAEQGTVSYTSMLFPQMH